MEGHLKMSKKEIRRIAVLENLKQCKISQKDAATGLSISTRQIRRIFQRYCKNGAKGLVHKSRGRISNRQTPKELEKTVIEKIIHQYEDFGPTLAQEKLLENHQINISVSKLRSLMIKENIWIAKTSRNGQVHSWRPRREKIGELVQADGSDHDWFEKRGPKCTLMAYIDDACNEAFGLFYGYEGTFPAMDSLSHYIQKYGLPENLYQDKHSTYKINRQATIDEELRGLQPETQFHRVLTELGINYIAAHSPQSKGRIERLFGTLQDRLVKELRLKNISTIVEANKFLVETFWPKYNSKFRKSPRSEINAHRPISKNIDLNWVFAIKDQRTITNGYTVHWNNHIFLLTNPNRMLRKRKVIIQQNLQGKVRLSTKDRILNFKEITPEFLAEKDKIKKAYIEIQKQKVSESIVQLNNLPKKSWMSNFALNSKAYALK